MKEYTNNNPFFSESFMMLESSDPGHADHFNEGTKQIFQNTLCNHQRINELNQSMMPEGAYDSDSSYVPGNYCLHENTLYRCIQETTGEWDASCWQQTSALGEIEGLRGTIVLQEAVISSLEEMLMTGNVVSGLVTGGGDRFVSVNGDGFKALKKIQFK